MKKGVFLGACLERHPDYNILYNDIDEKTGCDLICDMLEVDLSKFDYILASPPCNYYSRANYRRDTSRYAQLTKHLLPQCLINCAKSGKPFIIENVRNYPLMEKEHIWDICKEYEIKYQFVGRHTYFTNIDINLQCEQKVDRVQYGSYCSLNPNNYRQGGENVRKVFEIFLKYINKEDLRI